MKKLIIVALAILIFTACKKSSSGPATIVGTWYLNSTVTTYYSNDTSFPIIIFGIQGDSETQTQYFAK